MAGRWKPGGSRTNRSEACSVIRAEREVERRTLPWRTLSPDPPADTSNQSLHRCESDAHARIVRVRMQALEWLEQAPGVLHLEADTIVAHEVDRPRVLVLHAELDARVRHAHRILPRVFQQIAQHDADG